MKKRDMKKNIKYSYLKKGLKGIRLSFFILLFLVIFMVVYLLFSGFTIFQIFQIILRKPHLEDLCVIFAGFILFEVFPFYIATKIR